MKIAVIGYSGSGKSTLAAKLSEKYEIPVLYLDAVHFLPGWKTRDKKEELSLVRSFMENESWVIDGNYSGLMQEERLAQADKIILMKFNRFSCLARCVKRYMQNYVQGQGSRVRESMAEGCPEKLDREFAWWILHKGRDKKKRRHYRIIAGKYPEKIVVLRNQRQLNTFCEKEGL